MVPWCRGAESFLGGSTVQVGAGPQFDRGDVAASGVARVSMVESELNGRDPERVKMRPTDTDGFRDVSIETPSQLAGRRFLMCR